MKGWRLASTGATGEAVTPCTTLPRAHARIAQRLFHAALWRPRGRARRETSLTERCSLSRLWEYDAQARRAAVARPTRILRWRAGDRRARHLPSKKFVHGEGGNVVILVAVIPKLTSRSCSGGSSRNGNTSLGKLASQSVVLLAKLRFWPESIGA